jgi:hypothetical protein
MLQRLGLGFALALLVTPVWAAPVSLGSLLKEMTDLEALTRLPDPAYTCKQFSSYDQRSTDPGVPTDENWFANGDRGQYLRAEERNDAKEYVLMDAAGPGAIVRIWSANPADAGVLRIYLDGADVPVIETPLQDYLSGKNGPGLLPIAGERAQGWNSHLPIPYAQHCKVTTSLPDFYYHINYRTYAEGTAVETYSAEVATRDAAAIQAVAAALTDMPAPATAGEPAALRANLKPGKREQLHLEGPAAVQELTLSIDAPDNAAALRSILLEISFDGLAPQVVAPLGDFFGTAPGINPYRSLPSGVLEDHTLYSRWVMPFQRGAELTLRNTGDTSAMVVLKAHTAPYEWTNDTLYFHAKWRGALQIPTQPRQDWNYLGVQGKGRFVGVGLHIANPVRAWWGEGDEKIYVDGEKFPSHFGTGTEDYFGYAWCSPMKFTHAYHNQPRCDGPGNYGHSLVSRFHILDNIPFTNAFRFDMEVWHWAETTVDQFVMAYWYADAQSTDNTPAIDTKLLAIPILPDLPEVPRVKDALEGEKLTVRQRSGGRTEVQNGPWPWSAGEQLWWIDAQPGDTLTLIFNAAKAGAFDLRAAFTQAPDYGIVHFEVNGVPLAKPFDGYHSAVNITPEQSLGRFELKQGANELKVTITGAHPEADPRFMFGLDYLRLAPAE